MSDLRKQIEAILFASGKKITYEELARLCDSEIFAVKSELQNLKQEYEERESPIILTEESDGWKMTVREKYLSLVHKMLPETELSKSVLETLAVIAWKHPVLQSDVIKIRTNKAYEDIQELVERGFISKEKSGRSYIIKVTNKFNEYFELPNKEAIKKIFKDIQEHLKQEEAAEQSREHLGNLEVYEEEKSTEEKPKVKIYEENAEEESEQQLEQQQSKESELPESEEKEEPENSEPERDLEEEPEKEQEISPVFEISHKVKSATDSEKEAAEEEPDKEEEKTEDKEHGSEDSEKEESQDEDEERKLSPALEEIAKPEKSKDEDADDSKEEK